MARALAGDPLDADVARSIIDRDIAQLEERSRALKSRRNELAPISRFPPEVFCTIFSFIEDRNNSNRTPKSWINFSQVSQHWRSLALSAPELWTNIRLYCPRWAEEMLTRSKMAILTIRANLAHESRSSKAVETIKSCLSHMKRLGEINISGPSGSMLEKLFQKLPNSAPQLHTLHIENLSLIPRPHAPITTFTIHEDFLLDTERLKCLEFVNCNISWDSRFLTGLTRLTIHHSLRNNATSESSVVRFLHALQRMPALTDLDLKDSIPYDSGGLSSNPVAGLLVDLPCLRVLRISSGVGALTTALRYITFPSSTILNLTCEETRSAQIDFSDLLSVLVPKYLSSSDIRSLTLDDFESAIGLKFSVWTTVADFRGPAQLELGLKWPNSLQLLREIFLTKTLTAVSGVMNLSTLTELRISTGDHINSQLWVKTFGRLRLLERVHILSSSSVPSFFDALVHKTKSADKSQKAYRNVSFPKVRYLHLKQTNMRSVSFDMIMDCLMERYERNAEVRELRLDNCYNVSKTDIESLKEIVVDVIWDGVEQTDSTDYDSDGNTIYNFDSSDYSSYSF